MKVLDISHVSRHVRRASARGSIFIPRAPYPGQIPIMPWHWRPRRPSSRSLDNKIARTVAWGPLSSSVHQNAPPLAPPSSSDCTSHRSPTLANAHCIATISYLPTAAEAASSSLCRRYAPYVTSHPVPPPPRHRANTSLISRQCASPASPSRCVAEDLHAQLLFHRCFVRRYDSF